MNQGEQLLALADELARLRLRVENLERLEPPVLAACYNTDNGQGIPNNSSTIINFDNKVYDTHDAVTTGASWKFTAPVGGYYVVVAHVLFVQTTAWAESEIVQLRVHINGGGNRVLTRNTGQDFSGSAEYKTAEGVATLPMSAGDYIDIRVIQTSGAGRALYTDPNQNHVHIWKL